MPRELRVTSQPDERLNHLMFKKHLKTERMQRHHLEELGHNHNQVLLGRKSSPKRFDDHKNHSIRI